MSVPVLLQHPGESVEATHRCPRQILPEPAQHQQAPVDSAATLHSDPAKDAAPIFPSQLRTSEEFALQLSREAQPVSLLYPLAEGMPPFFHWMRPTQIPYHHATSLQTFLEHRLLKVAPEQQRATQQNQPARFPKMQTTIPSKQQTWYLAALAQNHLMCRQQRYLLMFPERDQGWKVAERPLAEVLQQALFLAQIAPPSSDTQVGQVSLSSQQADSGLMADSRYPRLQNRAGIGLLYRHVLPASGLKPFQSH